MVKVSVAPLFHTSSFSSLPLRQWLLWSCVLVLIGAGRAVGASPARTRRNSNAIKGAAKLPTPRLPPSPFAVPPKKVRSHTYEGRRFQCKRNIHENIEKSREILDVELLRRALKSLCHRMASRRITRAKHYRSSIASSEIVYT